MLNDLEKTIVNALFRNLRPLEILEELRAKNLILGDNSERAADGLIRTLEARRAEARECALEAATIAVRDGADWKSVVDYLSKPGLLHSGEVNLFARAAFEKIAAEKEAK